MQFDLPASLESSAPRADWAVRFNVVVVAPAEIMELFQGIENVFNVLDVASLVPDPNLGDVLQEVGIVIQLGKEIIYKEKVLSIIYWR